jgi:hypothetical protein
MAAIVGTLDTRVLVAVGDGEPVEVGTLTTQMHGTGSRAGVTLSTRKWRRDLAIAFIRMAWHTWTNRT